MENIQNEEMEIDLWEIFRALKKRALVILAAALLCACLACAYTLALVTPMYTSSSAMLVLSKEEATVSTADLQVGSQLTNDYSVLITSRPVLQEVINTLSLDMDYEDLEKKISVTNPEETRILELSVENPDPEMAKKIVDTLSEVSSQYIGEQMEVDPPKIIEEGEIPTKRTSPSMSKNVLLGFMAGLVVSAGLIVLQTVLDDTIKTEDDITKYLGLYTLSSVPDRKDYISGKKAGKKKKTKSRKGKKK